MIRGDFRQVQGPPETRAIPAGPLPAPLVEQQTQVWLAGAAGLVPLPLKHLGTWAEKMSVYHISVDICMYHM